MQKLSRAGVVFAALLAVNAVALAQGRDSSIKIRVDSILATDAAVPAAGGRIAPANIAGVKMDKRLRLLGIADRLTMMFNYASYHLIRHQEDGAALGDAVAFNLPGAHILHVSPMAIHGNILMLDLVLFEGARLIMRMPMRIVGDGMLLLVDEHNPNQYFITAISADVPRPSGDPATANVDSHPVAPTQAYPAFVPAQ